MKNKGRGFTLVELLAVIVILAIILVIAVPKITDTIKNSKKASYLQSVLPSVFLKFNIKIVSGSGTSSDPYILK